MAQFEATTSIEPDRVVVALAGECDLSVRTDMSSVLHDAVTKSSLVAVDLRELTFLDSSGIHELVAAHQAARAGGGRVYVRNASGVVAEVLDVTGVAQLLRPPNEDAVDG
jgi:anti-anti-sigma factor